MKDLTKATYEDALKSGISVVDIGASWCPDCQRIKPIMKELEGELASKVQFYNVSFDAEEELKDTLGIRRIPTLIFYKDGKEVGERLVEPGSKQKILDALQKVM